MKPREPWFLLYWTKSASGKVFLRTPLVIIWWPPDGNGNCQLNQWVPSWAVTKREKSQKMLEFYKGPCIEGHARGGHAECFSKKSIIENMELGEKDRNRESRDE